MSKFIGRRYISSGGDGYGTNDHSQLINLDSDDHLHYLITSTIRTLTSPGSGINKTGASAGDVFTLINAGTGAALYIRQTGTTNDADAAVDIDNTGNIGRGLSVSTNTSDPALPLVQFSALSPEFDEPVLSVTHATKDGLALYVGGDAYVSSQIEVGEAVKIVPVGYNPIPLGQTGVYIDTYDGGPSTAGIFYFVDADGYKHTFGTDLSSIEEAIHTIVKELDAYHPDITGTEHYNQHSEAIQTIINSLDGYVDGYSLIDHDELVRVSSTDLLPGYLYDKLIAGSGITLEKINPGDVESILISSTCEYAGTTSDGYFPFIEVDELSVAGVGSGTVANTSGYEINESIIRTMYNRFLIGDGTLEIKGLTLRSTIDADLFPQITYDVIKGATVVDDSVPNTILSGGVLLVSDEPTTENETYISGNRKDGEIQFTTGAIDFTDPKFDAGDGNSDGYYFFVFYGSHTNDTKTIVVQRSAYGPVFKHIYFTYPTCILNGQQQTDVRGGQTFDVEVITALPEDGYSQAISVKVNAGYAVQSDVNLSETLPGSGIWTGTVTARSDQPNGYADISVTAYDLLSNPTTATTTDLSDPLVSFDNDFPAIESFEEAGDFIYPPGQTCLKWGEHVDAYMTASDFTEILYDSPNGRFIINDPTVYSEWKQYAWSQGANSIEENLSSLSVNSVRIRARKWTNCSESSRYVQVRLDDTPPICTSILWRRNNVGSYVLTSPVLSVGTHGIQFIFDDPLIEIPEFIVKDDFKGTLSALTGTIPGSTLYATLTVTEADTDGCTELIMVTGINCSHKLPLIADPISGTYEQYCVDTHAPNIIRCEIDVDLIDGYWNDGYDGYNVMDDDADNLDNSAQACELDFSSGVQSITTNDILTRHGENVYVSVEVGSPFEAGDVCVFNASPWGASGTLSVPNVASHLYQAPFVTNLGSTRNDDQGRPIGRSSIMHATGGNATVTDLAANSDTAPNLDELSANGIDDVASYISFTLDGTSGSVFGVSKDSFRAFMPGRRIKIVDDNTAATYRTVIGSEIDGTNGVIRCDGGSLVSYTVSQNARAIPLGVTDAEVQAWDANKGLVPYINDGAFTHLTLIDFANPEAFSQHITNDQLAQNNVGTAGVDLFRANFWGSKLSVPNTGGGTEANPTGVANAKYVWRSKRIRLTTNPTGVQGTNIRFMVFGFSANTSYRNVNISATSDWDQNSAKFNLNNNDSQLEIRISTDDPFAAIPPYTNANWFLTTDYEVSPQSAFKFGKNKDINIVFSPPSTDVIDKDIYIEITLITNSSGKAPQIDMIGLSYLT